MEKFPVRKIKFTNKVEIDTQTQNDIIFHVKEAKKSYYEEIKKNSVDIFEFLSEISPMKLRIFFDFIRNEFDKRGIKDIAFNEIFFNKEINPKTLGRSTFTHMEIFDVEINDPKLKELTILKTLAHELYHDTSSHSFSIKQKTVTTQENIKIINFDVRQDSSGAGYREAMVGSALEEGAAAVFEKIIFDYILNKSSNDTREKYNKLTQDAAEEMRVSMPNIKKEAITIIRHNKNAKYFHTEFSANYYECVQLVEYLEESIPDFNNKLENLRVNKKSVEFARAVEDRFGKGAFKKIVTCKVDDAPKLLEELKNYNKL